MKKKYLDSNLVEITRLMIDALPWLEGFVLLHKYGLLGRRPLSYEDIGSKINRSPSEIEDAEISGLQRLRDPAYRKIVEGLRKPKNKAVDVKSIPPQLTEVIGTVSKLTPELVDHLRRREDDLIKLPPKIFEHLVAEFFASWGFEDVRLVGRNPKTSADIFAARKIHQLGISVRYFVEVKRWKHKIGVEVIDRVYGAMLSERPHFGWNAALIVSLVGFKDFKKYDRQSLALKGVDLKEREDLLRWLKDYKPNSNGLWLPNPKVDL